MKLLFFSLSFIISLNSFSQEKYICSLDLSDYGRKGFQVSTYERVGDVFINTTNNGNKYYCTIVEDNEDFDSG